ncbi:biopolymer transporter ExbD [Mariniblastus sp.]|nr:biopolymer transporter ExbD [Mariniblastus sp.]MDA7906307.1 biopolymer transporter ExbD [Mariniblastus sp.]MDC3223772.1 biopolymer transporter ExbD [Mariniblastus sp.]
MSKKKKKKSQPDPNTDGEGFGLNKPTGQFSDLDIEMKKKLAVEREELASQIYRPTPEDGPDDVTYKNMGWRGMEEVEDDDDDEPDVAFEKKEIPEDELDMTPMVDVTFLLLIFFMVTASFTLQKSLEQPPAKSDQPSTEVQEDDEILDDYVQVTIDQTNTYYVTTRDDEEVECPSDSEMRSRVKDAKETTSATRMIILAHVDSTHAKLVTAWDTGVINGIETIEIQTTDEEF